eukprot:7717068-Alexandrium_andersonii.AAC.1
MSSGQKCNSVTPSVARGRLRRLPRTRTERRVRALGLRRCLGPCLARRERRDRALGPYLARRERRVG